MYTGADLTLLDTDGLGVKLLTHPGLRAINAESVTAVPDNAVINASAHPLLQTWRTDYGNGTMLLALFNLVHAWGHSSQYTTPKGLSQVSSNLVDTGCLRNRAQ